MNAGTLNINNAAALGNTNASGTFTLNGGTLDNTSGAAISVANQNILNTNIVFTGSNQLTFSSTVALGASRTITVNGSPLVLSGVVSGTGFGITKQGAGQLSLNGA